MNVAQLQTRLQAVGRDPGPADGRFGPRSAQAFLAAITCRPAPLAAADLKHAADLLGVSVAHIGAVYDVESAGRGLHPVTHLPIILYEPHIFHRLTKGAHAADWPAISYARWGAQPYPPSQAGRYEQLLQALALDPDAALQSASYGLFQIMGFNYAAAGADDPLAFVLSQGAGEREQLVAFARFVQSRGLVDELKAANWTAFARAYNGPSFARNAYDQKLKAAFVRRGGR